MRNLVYIGTRDCKACKHYRETVIDPLLLKYPGSVEVHMGYDRKVAEANARKEITKVPTMVVEKGGTEEFRFTGFPKFSELEEIVTCDSELTPEEWSE